MVYEAIQITLNSLSIKWGTNDRGHQADTKGNDMSKLKLGKIYSAEFGLGGYQETMLGLHLSFSFGGNSRISISIAAWDYKKIECTDSCKWSEKDRSNEYSEIMRKLSSLLDEANVDNVLKLKGIPVEVTLVDNAFKSFRILKEVL